MNTELQRDVDELKIDDGIVEAAREELGYIRQGERRQTVVDMPDVPADLPDGWPYSPVEQIINLRLAAARTVRGLNAGRH